MFKYIILKKPEPFVQILYGNNVIDETGPWESLTAAIYWAEAYVYAKNQGIEEPAFE